MIFRFFILVFIGFYTTAIIASPIAEQIDRIIVFGDSLSDNGNDYLLTSKLHQLKNTIPIIPDSQHYWSGRFSNGPIWADYLSGIFHFTPLPYSADLRSSEQFQNFAYGGAWAEPFQFNQEMKEKIHGHWHLIPPPLSAQINNYLLKNKSSSAETLHHDLIFIWIGGNDYLNQELTGVPTPRPLNESTNAVITAIEQSVTKLIEAGNRHFVLLGLPNFSHVPTIILRDPKEQSLSPILAATTELHNQKLQQLIANFSQNYPNIHIHYIDMAELFDEEFTLSGVRAQEYRLYHRGHFQKPTTPCLLEPSDPDPTSIFTTLAQRIEKDTYPYCDLHHAADGLSIFNYGENYNAGGIFFDHIHPLTHIHAKIALAICRQLSLLNYQYRQNQAKGYQTFSCSHLSLSDLLNAVTELPFPLQGISGYSFLSGHS